MTDWFAIIVAAIALLVSVATAVEAYIHRRRETRTANVTAYFHWNRELSRVDLADGKSFGVGYNLVIWNQGPASAHEVTATVVTPDGDDVDLATVEAEEFPLPRLDATGRYPIQFAPTSSRFRSADNRPVLRRFNVHLSWRDGNGHHQHMIPLRRGQTSM
jgi:hypothetical protein